MGLDALQHLVTPESHGRRLHSLSIYTHVHIYIVKAYHSGAQHALQGLVPPSVQDGEPAAARVRVLEALHNFFVRLFLFKFIYLFINLF